MIAAAGSAASAAHPAMPAAVHLPQPAVLQVQLMQLGQLLLFVLLLLLLQMVDVVEGTHMSCWVMLQRGRSSCGQHHQALQVPLCCFLCLAAAALVMLVLTELQL
jgi:hypothetical protein